MTPGDDMSMRRKSTLKPAIGERPNAEINCSAACACGGTIATPRPQLIETFKPVMTGIPPLFICDSGTTLRARIERLHHQAVRVQLKNGNRQCRSRRRCAAR